MTDGLALRRIGYSSAPIFAVPLRVHRGGDVCGRQTPREQLLQIEVDDDLAHLASDGQGELRPLHGRQAGSQEVRPEVVDLLLGEGGARQAELKDRDVGSAVRHHQGRRRARRQLPEDRLGGGRNLCDRASHRGPGLHVDLHHGHACERLAFQVLDATDRRRDRAFELRRDAPLHLDGGKPGVLPDGGDHRNVDLGVHVRRHAQGRGHAHQDDEHGKDDERIGPPKSETNDPHCQLPLDSSTFLRL